MPHTLEGGTRAVSYTSQVGPQGVEEPGEWADRLAVAIGRVSPPAEGLLRRNSLVLLGIVRVEGKRHYHCRALARPTPDLDGPAVGLRDPLAYRQAEPRA